MKKSTQRILIALFLGATLVWAVFFTWPSPDLEITFCDVGQGDAALIQSPRHHQMLIDGGPSEKKILECLEKNMPFWDRKIEFVVLSHPHSDHLSGLIAVLNHYNVGQIISTDVKVDSSLFQEWQDLIKKKHLPLEFAANLAALDLGGGAIASIIYPQENFGEQKIDNLNNTSLVLRLEYKGVSCLFPGDAEKEEQEKILTLSPLPPLHSIIYKVPHHGSKNALEENFLETVAPQIAIISVGKENKYGLPKEELLSALKNRHIQIKRTDENGTIKIKVKPDGKYTLN